MKYFTDLTKEEKLALFSYWLDHGKIEQLNVGKQDWTTIYSPTWSGLSQYRIPLRKEEVDWSAVSKDYNFLARDSYGRAFLYTNKPCLSEDTWSSNTGRADSVQLLSSYKRGTTGWKESLVERPKC